MKNIYCVIMAGGQGSRLWPLSQMELPKQFVDLTGVGKTMLQLTYERFRTICEPDHFVVVTNKNYVGLAHEQLPEMPAENILCEPFRRNTAACIAFATLFIKQKDPDVIEIVTPSDQLIINEKMFIENAMAGVEYAGAGDNLITIGVKAYKPETAFGYIQVGSPVSEQFPTINKVKTFTEKPNEEMAQVFYECGDFCWNSGVFIWSVRAISDALTKFLPNIQKQFDALDKLPSSYWTEQTVSRIYEECENVSIDYGVMEKAQNVFVVQTDAQWSDLGSWDALYEQGEKDARQNVVVNGKAIIYDSDRCLIHVSNDKYCIIDGLQDYMIVDQEDILLICPRTNGQKSWKYATELNLKLNNKS